MFPLYDENRSSSIPLVTWALIIVNGLVFLWEFTQEFDPMIFYEFGAIPIEILRWEHLSSLITSMFVHAGFWHILGNMLYLFIFGDNVEDRFGHTKHLILFLVSGIAGGLAHSIVTVTYGGADAFIPAVGASGAVAGILGAYVVFFPRARIMSIIPSFVFVRLARIPAVIFIGLWFVIQLLYTTGDTSVAYMAHIGGFVVGLLAALLLRLTTYNRAGRAAKNYFS